MIVVLIGLLFLRSKPFFQPTSQKVGDKAIIRGNTRSVHNTVEVWEQLQTGSRNISVGSTNCNELSSRSHCLFRVTVKGENLVNGQRTRIHLWLVDLAVLT
ncbi:hypothetical protein MKX03_020147, partial [Papaver bracteatum]